MDEEARFEVYSGIVGRYATAFFAHKKTAGKAIKLVDILKDYSKGPSSVKAKQAKDAL